MDFNLLYVTVPDRVRALAIARTVVGERLAACANVLDGLTSVFHWQGAVQEEAEALLVLKTRADLVEAATARIKALHDYECPCVVALPIAGGNVDFLKWIGDETTSA